MTEDSDNRGYNVGTWVVNWSGPPAPEGNFSWEDAPPMYHLNTSTYGFADAHVEPHRWTDSRIIKAGTASANGTPESGFTGLISRPGLQMDLNPLALSGLETELACAIAVLCPGRGWRAYPPAKPAVRKSGR